MLTLSEKRKIGKMLRDRYDNARNIRFADDGAVYLTTDCMPNTNNLVGRIFAGWDTDLLREAEYN